MSNSPLVTYTKLSPNRNSPRNHKIDTITIHCTAGQGTARQLLNLSHFTTYDPDNGASCNYAVGKDGSIGLCVNESDRSWCSSNRENDHRAVTIEVSSDSYSPYKVTEAAYAALIDLCVDICRRNGIQKLLWRGDKSLMGQVDKQNMTAHRWFAAKACPGDYLYSRFGDIAARVNERLEEPEMTQEQFNQMMDAYFAQNGAKPVSDWAQAAWLKAQAAGIFDGSAPHNPLTREQAALVLDRLELLE